MTRPIELARLNLDFTWHTVMVDIPATTHPDKVEEVAKSVAKEVYGDHFYVLYNNYEDEIPEINNAWIVSVENTAVCKQRFLVEAKGEVEAIDEMNKGHRDLYGNEEVIEWLGYGESIVVAEKW